MTAPQSPGGPGHSFTAAWARRRRAFCGARKRPPHPPPGPGAPPHTYPRLRGRLTFPSRSFSVKGLPWWSSREKGPPMAARPAPTASRAKSHALTQSVWLGTRPLTNRPSTATVIAATEMDYPKAKFTVWLLDDGGTDQKCNQDNPKKAREARDRRLFLKNHFKGLIWITHGVIFSHSRTRSHTSPRVCVERNQRRPSPPSALRFRPPAPISRIASRASACLGTRSRIKILLLFPRLLR